MNQLNNQISRKKIQAYNVTLKTKWLNSNMKISITYH